MNNSYLPRFLLTVLLMTVPVVSGSELSSSSGDSTALLADRVARMEYRFESATGESASRTLTATNRAHGFRSRIDARRVTIEDRVGGAETWVVAIEPSLPNTPRASVREGRSWRVEGGGIESVGRAFHERWENDANGLHYEVGLPSTVTRGSGERGVLELRLGGTLRPRESGDRSIELVDERGTRRLRLEVSAVRDVAGGSYAATLRYVPDRRGLVVEVGAGESASSMILSFTITGGPTILQADQAQSRFGDSVFSAGDVNGDGYSDVIVGAPFFDNGEFDEGRVFLFLGSPSGIQTTSAWTFESNDAFALLGTSVATAGDVNNDGYSDVIVGCRGCENGQSGEGLAFVFHGSPAGLSSTPATTLEVDAALAGFGGAVAPAGDVNGDGFSDVLVGAENFENGQSNEGAAYVFLGSASGVLPVFSWMQESNLSETRFGSSLAGAADANGDGYSDIVVGARSAAGLIQVFAGSPTGVEISPLLTLDSAQTSIDSATSVAWAGDVDADGYSDLLVGFSAFDNAFPDAGSAYLYLGSASGPATSPVWTIEGTQTSEGLGVKVASAGDVNGDGYADVLVGASNFDGSEVDEGAVRLYLGGPTGLSLTPDFEAFGGQAAARLAVAASAGDVNGDGLSDIVLGASLYDDGQVNEGAAFVYLGETEPLSQQPSWELLPGENAREATGVASSGDVDGDGFDDVMVAESGRGQVNLYKGSPDGPSTLSTWFVSGSQDLFGRAVDGGSDVNGDGFADMLVLESGSSGELQLYLGSSMGPAETPDWIFPFPGGAGVGFGRLMFAGDVNGDGFHDVLAGIGSIPEILLFHGSENGLPSQPNLTLPLGPGVADAGDVNGDGYADVLVSDSNFDSTVGGDVGYIALHTGTPAGLNPVALTRIEGDVPDLRLGGSLGGVGDVNGDGYSDVLVEAFIGDNTHEVRLYNGNPGGLNATPSWVTVVPNSSFGFDFHEAGDLNGDGYSDLVIVVDDPITLDDRALVYLGSPSGPVATSILVVGGIRSANGAGDVDGDGDDDLILGTRFATPGLATIYDGRGGRGVVISPRSRRVDDSAPIVQGGLSDDRNAFRISALGRSPQGRARVKLEWEVQPRGVPFDGAATSESVAWFDTDVTGVALSETVGGGVPGEGLRWRARLRYDPVVSPTMHFGPWWAPPMSDLSEADVKLPTEADLRIDQFSVAPPAVLTSQLLEYSVTMTNVGPDDADTGLRHVLPTGATFVSATPSQGTCLGQAEVVNCALGPIVSGAGASVVILAMPPSVAGTFDSEVSVSSPATDPDPANDAVTLAVDVVTPKIGGRIWDDSNADGIQDAGEPSIPGVLVVLQDAPTDTILDTRITDAGGTYLFDDLDGTQTYELRVLPPADSTLSPPDQTTDDLDSDPIPQTLQTNAITILDFEDATRWDAGLIPYCLTPDEPVYIEGMRVTVDGDPILDYQDPNQPGQVTGYNVYRSSDSALAVDQWPILADDITDMDEASPNLQYVDTSGDVSPSGVWYYQVTAFNSRCPVGSDEGPF